MAGDMTGDLTGDVTGDVTGTWGWSVAAITGCVSTPDRTATLVLEW